jgi:hypothetical protein
VYPIVPDTPPDGDRTVTAAPPQPMQSRRDTAANRTCCRSARRRRLHQQRRRLRRQSHPRPHPQLSRLRRRLVTHHRRAEVRRPVTLRWLRSEHRAAPRRRRGVDEVRITVSIRTDPPGAGIRSWLVRTAPRRGRDRATRAGARRLFRHANFVHSARGIGKRDIGISSLIGASSCGRSRAVPRSRLSFC